MYLPIVFCLSLIIPHLNAGEEKFSQLFSETQIIELMQASNYQELLELYGKINNREIIIMSQFGTLVCSEPYLNACLQLQSRRMIEEYQQSIASEIVHTENVEQATIQEEENLELPPVAQIWMTLPLKRQLSKAQLGESQDKKHMKLGQFAELLRKTEKNLQTVSESGNLTVYAFSSPTSSNEELPNIEKVTAYE